MLASVADVASGFVLTQELGRTSPRPSAHQRADYLLPHISRCATRVGVGDVLKQRIRQSKFDSPAHEALLNLLVAAGHVRALVDEACAGHDITQPQFNVLRILRGAHPGGLPRGEISARMIERAPDVTRLIDRLETAGLVDRVKGSRRPAPVRHANHARRPRVAGEARRSHPRPQQGRRPARLRDGLAAPLAHLRSPVRHGQGEAPGRGRARPFPLSKSVL